MPGKKQVKAPASASAVPEALFLLSTLGQRLGLWVSGFPLPIVLLLAPFIICYALLIRRLKCSLIRTLLFSAMLVSFATSFVFARPETTSLQSAILFAAMYGPWIFWAPATALEYTAYLRRVALWVSIFSILAAVQYLGQFAYSSELWFSWRLVVPEFLLIEYNALNEMAYGTAVYKGNGFFLLEPSTLSGLVARLFLATVLLLGTLNYAIPYAIGLLFAFSGTGLVFTAIFTVPVIVRYLVRKIPTELTLTLIVSVAIILAYSWSSTPLGDYFSGRLGEFADPRSSGYARFSSPLIVFERMLTRDLGTFLIGHGPGSFRFVEGNPNEEIFGSGWIKIFVEYGFMGFLTFSTFFLYCVYSSTRSFYLAFALLAQFLILDGSVLVPQLVFLTYAVFVLPGRSTL